MEALVSAALVVEGSQQIQAACVPSAQTQGAGRA